MKEYYIVAHIDNLQESKLAEEADEVEYEQVKCSKTKGHMRSGKRVTPLYVNVPKVEHDVVWTWQSDCLVTDKFLACLHKNNVTGYSVQTIIVKQDKRKNRRRLYELIVSGSKLHIGKESGYEVMSVCDVCGAVKIKEPTMFAIDDDIDIKTDFFMFKEYIKYIFVNEKVKAILEENKITGVEFRKMKEFRFSRI